MEGCEFTRVVTKDGEECFLLTKLRNEGQDGFDLTICHDGKVWSGTVSEDDLDSLSTKLKMDYKKYVKQTVEALTSVSDTDSFLYQLTSDKNGVEFAWKKHVEDITFQLGSARLKSRPDSAVLIKKIFIHCITGMEELKTRIQRLETDNERLSLERMNALKRLEKCVVAKEELENDLYSKFALILNSKKEKIRQLKGAEDDVGKTRKRSRSPEQETTQSLAATSAEEPDTDDEKPKAKRQVRGGKKRVSDGDESLILGDDDDTGDAVVSRPRRQRGRPQKKQTPSKPILPRVGSNEATPGTSRTRSLRKSGSNTSRTSDNIDDEDLMDQL
ncbi:DNA repair protein XRCC4-like isoform X2 [Mya arenaria]|uniref:DNA repair protein XRCC4-like isoform X2 n=1 Tax=Mya arenaria TaxID=6604 RepID=UPI0022E76707|nr:DNA repair protein XRCC4-like isoform X2 [Mya arenaria]